MTRNKLKILGIFFLTFVLVLIIGFFILNDKYNKMVQKRTVETETQTIDDLDEEIADEIKKKAKELEGSINILLLGTDDGGYRTDSTILIHYDTYSKSSSMFSIPRDYMVKLSKSAQEKLAYYSPIVKFTEIFAYAKMAKMESPSSYITQIIEEMLGIKINHFILIDLTAFREAVDSVGGIDIYVPQRMRWSDPLQNLNIDLKPGFQHLDGEMAEGLVRFRQGYDGNDYGDFGRMQMQQYFLKAYIKKLFSVESFKNINSIISSLVRLVKTDASLTDSIVILNTVKSADFEKVNSHTLPGSGGMVDGKYYIIPPGGGKLKRYFLETVINDTSPAEKNSKKYQIEVYSSSWDTEVSMKITDKLKEDGYNASFVGVSSSERTINTKIIVPDSEIGFDLKKYFDLSEIISELKPLNENEEKEEKEKVIKIIVGEAQQID